MWVSKQSKKRERESGTARMGLVTAAGRESDVYFSTQRCRLPVLAPGGYRWRPEAGRQVLVLKTGAEERSACVLAQREESETELQPGEVELYAPKCGLKLTEAGEIELHGSVRVNGATLEDVIARAVAAALGTGEG